MGDTCTVDLDLTAWRAQGDVRWGGHPITPAGSGAPSWELSFRTNAQGRNGFFYPMTGGEAYDVRVYDGTYDVVMELLSPSAVADRPQGRYRVVGGLRVDRDLELDLDIPLYPVGGEVSWNGAAFANPSGTDWRVTFRDAAGYSLTWSEEGGKTSWGHAVPAGTYDVDAELFKAGLVPGQPSGTWPLARGLRVNGPIDLPLTPPVATVEGTLSWGDGIPDVSPTAAEWSLSFRDTSSGRVYVSPQQGGETWTGLMYPGVYDVSFDFGAGSGGGSYPTVMAGQVEGPITVARSVRVEAGRVLTLDLAPPAVALTGTARLNGLPLRDTPNTREWALTFVSPDRRTRYRVPLDGGDAWAGWMYPGIWDVYAEILDLGAAPGSIGGAHLVARDVVIDQGAHLDVALETHGVSGSIAWDGLVIPKAPTGSAWRLRFARVDGRGDESATLTSAGGVGTYNTRLYPGTWDVYLRLEQQGLVVDQVGGERRVAAGLRVEGDTRLDIDPPLVEIYGEVAFEGGPLANSQPGKREWALVFEERATGRWHDLRFDGGDDTWSGQMYPGTWDVFLLFLEGGVVSPQPWGWLPVARDVVLAGPPVFLRVEPPLVPVGGIVAINGEPIPDLLSGQEWVLNFIDRSYARRDPERRADLYLEGDMAWDAPLPAGYYNIIFHLQPGVFADLPTDGLQLHACGHIR